jgi:short-subunit dehydrogenase
MSHLSRLPVLLPPTPVLGMLPAVGVGLPTRSGRRPSPLAKDRSGDAGARARGWALVTGASSGIGNAFARHLAAAGWDVVLVARNNDRLVAEADAIRTRDGVRVEVLVADLVDRDDLLRVERRLGSVDEPVLLLVNNAGFALRKPLLANSVDEEEALLDIHVRAVLRLTKAAVDAMAARGSGSVVNVASVAAWAPRGTYSAHKAWTIAFSEAVASQVASSGVRVMALCPGFVKTELLERSGLTVSVPKPLWVDVDRLVADAMRDLERGRRVSVPSKRYATVSHLLRHLPHALTIRDRPARR